MKIGDKICYGFSVMEFVGEIVLVASDFIEANGVELGCGAKEKSVVLISNLKNITVLGDSEFIKLTTGEPAFLLNKDS